MNMNILAQKTRSSLSLENNGQHTFIWGAFDPAILQGGMWVNPQSRTVPLFSSARGEQPAAAYRSPRLVCSVLPHCSANDALQDHQRSASASPCKSWPVSGQGFALSLLHAGKTPAVFLMLSVSKCQGKYAAFFFSIFMHLLILSSVMLPLQPSLFFSTFSPILLRQLAFLVEKLFLQLKPDRNKATLTLWCIR